MTSYVDTYISDSSLADLQTFTQNFVNVITIQPGRAAIPQTTDSEGNIIPAVPAAGNPALYYTCVRTTFDLTPLLSGTQAAVDPVTGAAVVGVWS